MFKRCSFFLIIFLFVFSFTSSYAYQGPKQRIAVTKFENKVKGVYGNWNLGSGFSEMLVTELMKTGRFIVVERQALTDVLGEQELGQAGIIRKETAAKVGQVLGAQIIVRGVVSEFDMQKSGGGGGIGIGGFRLGLKGSNAHVAVDIRLIDSSTGQVLHSHNAAGTASSSGIGIGVTKGDVDFNSNSFQKTPLGEATRQAIHNVIEFIVSKMKDMPISAKIIKISGNKVFLNAGATMNIQPGDKFLAYSKGESMIDPDTGLNLGSEDTLVGTVEVTDVKDKYSIGLLEAGSGTLKRGDILKFQ
jgi:curli biogenesis system outer membrane secretion channel CsgG